MSSSSTWTDGSPPTCTPNPEAPGIGARFRRNSLMEPLVDGEETFARPMTPTSMPPGERRGRLFRRVGLQGLPPALGDQDTRLDKIAAAINRERRGDQGPLAAEFVQANEAALDSLSREMGLAVMAADLDRQRARRRGPAAPASPAPSG